jgi:4-aminobutyrate aminotransferase
LDKKKYAKIVVTPPGPKSIALHTSESKVMRHASKLYEIAPVHMQKGEGRLLTDVDGNVYIDFASGVNVTYTGHCHPKVVKAIKEQAEQLLFSYVWGHPVRNELLQKLVEIGTPLDLKNVGLASEGTVINEAAIRTAKEHTKRQTIVSFYEDYFGGTMASAAACGKAYQRRGYYPTLPPNYIHMPYPLCYRCLFHQEYPDCDLLCLDYVENALTKYEAPENIAAFMTEPLMATSACNVPPDEFLPRLKKFAETCGALLITDEVQTFPGRTGKMFMVNHFGVKPDILTAAKGVSSGVPMAILMCRKDISPQQGGTFSGNPVACAAALATITTIIEERLVENAANVGEYMKKRIQDFSEEHELIGAVHGKGLLIGVELVKDRKTKTPATQEGIRVIQKCCQNGLIILNAGLYGLHVSKLTPALNITKDEADEGLDIFEDAIRSTEKER